ncbi:hypothetical protein B0H15DRAFT_542299 [Mycena belliarum]|uniref:RRM domain-containing protein n=1 Tax=Mycena belliarum TaxID=1033014 RepID=A0AAD6UDP7_9AGAR|nr:hypothetical protein B0H15DRAFT_542299 [Mycena belliae]
MNVWLRTPSYRSLQGILALPTRHSGSWSSLTTLHRRFSQTQRTDNEDTPDDSTTTGTGAISRTPLTDELTAARAIGPGVAPLTHRAISVTNIPPNADVADFLLRVDSGALEYVKFTPGEPTSSAELTFLDEHGAARFFAESRLLYGRTLSCTWLPYRPLDPIVATAAARDGARRVLYLYKATDRQDVWSPADLHAYLSMDGAVELQELEVLPATGKGGYHELAVARFADVASAIRTHARIRADSSMARVHVAYGPDPCSLPLHTRLTLKAIDRALDEEPQHAPTYFPDGGKPFTTVKLHDVPRGMGLADLCARLFGGPLHAVDLKDDGTATVTFFRAEDARDFLARAGFVVSAEPQTAAPQPLPLHYTRVLRVRVFDVVHPVITRTKLAADFALFGRLERVWVRRNRRHLAFVAFARADDALRALEGIAVVRPEYLACNVWFAADPCARGAEDVRRDGGADYARLAGARDVDGVRLEGWEVAPGERAAAAAEVHTWRMRGAARKARAKAMPKVKEKARPVDKIVERSSPSEGKAVDGLKLDQYF